MTDIAQLPSPLNNIVIETGLGQYRDFGLDETSEYPLRGVKMHARYGYLPGYTAEDDADLDFFVGDDVDGRHGWIRVYRGDDNPEEHKFFVNMSDNQIRKTLDEYKPVLRGAHNFDSLDELLKDIARFRNTS